MSTNSRKVRAVSRFSPAGTLAASVLAILATAADAQAVTQWDLPGQPLAKSLRDIAAQSESNIIFDKKLVSGQQARPLKIKASAEEALSQVLEGTGLTFRQLDDKTVTIQLASTDPMATTSAAYNSDGRIRLAQAQTSPSGQGERQPRTIEGRTLLDIEEIIVTGTNIRGIENNTAPITVLSREYINATGYSTVSKLLESVTQNFALANQSGQVTPGVTVTREQGSSINLRGIGEGTTLVLLNGRRIAPGYRSAAVDISALPLSAIERVEILPDGASALYGSDAVGGVVNFILREDFEGAETRLRAGVADGVDEYRASQALGNAWESGNALVSVEYLQRDRLASADRDFIGANSLIDTLLPETEQYSAMFTGKQQIGSSLSVFADALYTRRDTEGTGRRTFAESVSNENDQIATTLGVDWSVAGDWNIQLSAGYNENTTDQVSNARVQAIPTLPINVTVSEYSFDSQIAELKADGSLFSLPGGKVSMAIGAAYRTENYEETIRRLPNTPLSAQDVDQDVTSAYGEVYVPLFSEANAVTGVQSLELSLAGRYDDYSTAGSSFDPQAGLMWEPVKGLRLRARYGTSYKAPNLVDYSLASNSALALAGNIPGLGPTRVLSVNGIAVDSLRPQESESSSFGLEFTPEGVAGLSVSLNYYKIRYTGLIANPGAVLTLLSDLNAFSDLLIFNPSVDQVNQFIAIGQLGQGFASLIPNFTPDQVDVIVDGRRRNLSVVSSNGIDLATEYNFNVGANRFFIGLGGTYVLNRDQQVTANSAEIDTADTIYNPPSYRARGFVTWQRQGVAANMFVNHVDSYVDNRATTPVANSKVDSLTTVDLRLSYDFSNKFSSGFLSGFSVALSAQNVLDEDPPSVFITPTSSTFDLGFDPVNADPLGRLISLEFVKTW
ncbi:TonB-dependent receptor [Steroidobacter sp. S1-65]|uniref:TonB-dependent receptor n=1 Tax=Steroidobacter gossypii TaxID=2805490 RepID=A0ABS1X220_9GAMM|nr:TonB-dependent receptor [Steroidobacter gossypii]MBM0107285.1 TonB-dependent receptor [Steroidobacter gossypii]